MRMPNIFEFGLGLVKALRSLRRTFFCRTDMGPFKLTLAPVYSFSLAGRCLVLLQAQNKQPIKKK